MLICTEHGSTGKLRASSGAAQRRYRVSCEEWHRRRVIEAACESDRIKQSWPVVPLRLEGSDHGQGFYLATRASAGSLRKNDSTFVRPALGGLSRNLERYDEPEL